MNINLKGTFFLSQLVAKQLIKEKKENPDFEGSIVNISSISAGMASVNRGQYCISKAGLGMVTKLFATKLGDFDIPVYEVRPGIIDTDMTSGVKEKYDQLFNEGLSIQRRWGTSDDVGKAVAALLRNDFSYSTGQVIMIEGGMTIGRL
jgi:NAD(P)-dependent dehydrogenase (short-subunit alcohol dehydrogenase family)